MLLLLALDLSAIKNEPNLEKRSDLALDYANTALDSAREAMTAGDDAKIRSALAEVGVGGSFLALATDTGKYARNNKSQAGEVRTRELLRRLDGLRDTASVDDQPAIEKVRARVAEVHDGLIQGIMGKKAKK